MGSIAQVKRDRQAQLNKLKQAMRAYDSKQEVLQRLINRYRGKRKMLESTDMPALNNAFRDMNANFSAIERELANLARVVAGV